jgi:sulfide:quinone oxidoreductase
MAHVAIVGAGIGGVSCAYELRKQLAQTHRISLIGSSAPFEFTPSNPSIAVGWRTLARTRVALREPLAARGIEWCDVAVASIDAPGNTLTLADGRKLAYDYLVITTGPKLAFEEVPGLGPQGFTESVCTQAHAAQAWEKYQRFVENPGPIVVGAAAGASCFGPAYEFAMIVDTDLRKRKIRDRVPMTFVTSEPYIGHMGLGGVGDSKGLMEAELRQRHIKWITNAKITGVAEGSMSVTEHDEEGKPQKEVQLPFRFAMVLPAFMGVDAVAAVPIESMVHAICENIGAEISGRPATAQGTWNAICLADFGDSGAAFVALPEIPPRNVTWTKVGKWVHLAKIAFEKYFLRKVRTGSATPVYEKYLLRALGISSLKRVHP